uniref:Uncharacterized protein n=1 Tax=Nelumbo nucifera TaxID=4432 RepID=A0A822ZNL3_NELNU|nr:TPA_asm: hypothetical protein HUJ06_003325 [Nelumbo nucifera]
MLAPSHHLDDPIKSLVLMVELAGPVQWLNHLWINGCFDFNDPSQLLNLRIPHYL